MSKTREFIRPLTALLLLGCADVPTTAPSGQEGSLAPSFSATSEWDVVSFPFEVFPYLDCLDETVTWTGEVTFKDHWVSNKNFGHLNGKADLEPGSTMVGPASGTWVNPEVRSQNGGTNDDFRIVERITWTNEATGSLMDVDTRFHLIIGGNGELSLRVEQHTCRLR
jgi:hypothetical protein